MSHSLFAVILGVIGSATVLFAAAPAAAQSLTAELLLGSVTFFARHNCDTLTSPTARFNYGADGIAVGPYPGTFTETGTFRLGAVIAGSSFREVLGFRARFVIRDDSGRVVVTGKKQLAQAPPDDGSAGGICLGPPVLAVPITIGAVTGGQVCYEARIVGTGTFDRGTSRIQAVGPNPAIFEGFQEDFTSDPAVDCRFGNVDEEEGAD